MAFSEYISIYICMFFKPAISEKIMLKLYKIKWCTGSNVFSFELLLDWNWNLALNTGIRLVRSC